MAKGIFYKITKNGKTSYLFGTHHHTSTIPSAVDKALEKADAVFFEVKNMNPTLEETEEALAVFGEWWREQASAHPYAAMMMDAYTEELLEKMSQKYKDTLDVNFDEWKPLPPNRIILSLFFAILKKLEMVPAQSLDYTIQLKAERLKKPISGLELLATQEKLANGVMCTYDEQYTYLNFILENYSAEEYIAFTKSMCEEGLRAYLNEDLDQILALTRASLKNEDNVIQEIKDKIYEVMITERDASMAENMEAPLTSGNAFFAIGGGHLPGVIKKLRDREYVVEALPLKEAQMDEKPVEKISLGGSYPPQGVFNSEPKENTVVATKTEKETSKIISSSNERVSPLRKNSLTKPTDEAKIDIVTGKPAPLPKQPTIQ